jgi:tRNA pseudouridine55 synthase
MPTSFHGLLVVDKPRGLTSRDVVNRCQGWFPRGTRIGHTGTLDPLATGVLVLCVGVATRLAEYVQRLAKTYRAGILLGSRSDTDDAEGTVTRVACTTPPDRATVESCLSGFLGPLEQRPPTFSAAKVAGRRAYDRARRGQDVDLQPRRICIHRIDVLAYDYPHLEIEVCCSKGTYIRSLARDLGERLGCGGLIESLRRTQVGSFNTEDAVSLSSDPATARARLLPISAAVSDLPALNVDEETVTRLRQRRTFDANTVLPPDFEEVAMFAQSGELVAVGRIDRETGQIRPEKVLIV